MYKPRFKTKHNGVPVLSKKQIEIIGENFIRDFCPQALEIPQEIDIDAFCENYRGLTIDYQYLSNDGRYLGMMVFNDTDRVIVYDPEHNRADYIHANARTVLIDNTLLEENQEHRYRYTVGHEVGHDVFHFGYFGCDVNQLSMFDMTQQGPMVQCRVQSIEGSSNALRFWSDADWMEWQANFFSSVILMPATSVRKLIKSKKYKTELFKEYCMIQDMVRTFNVSPEAAKYRLKELGFIDNYVGEVGFLNFGLNLLPNE